MDLRITNTKLKKTVDNLCRAIIDGTEPVLPPGYIAHEPAPGMQNAQTQQQSKQLMRHLLTHYLGDKPLHTRQLLIDLQGL